MKKIAVVGVLETAGREILSLLEEQGYKASEIVAVDIKAPLGTQVSFGEDDDLDVVNLDDYTFNDVLAAVFATSAEVSKKYVPKALSKKIKIVDCSQAFISETDVPMVVAGVNDEAIASAARGLVSVPEAAVTQLLLPLKTADEQYEMKRIVCTTYNSASVYGKDGMDELFTQTRKIYMNDTLVDAQNIFHKQAAFNVIPQVGEFIGDETDCEWSVNAQTKKVLNRDIKVHANCAIVPVFIGTGMYVNIEFNRETDVDVVRDLMKKTPGVVVFDKHVDGGYVTMTDVQGESDVYISRLRQDTSVESGISFWTVADNLRFGVAKNACAVLKKILEEQPKN